MTEEEKAALLEQIDQTGERLVELILNYFRETGSPIGGYSVTLHKPRYTPVLRKGGVSLMIRGPSGQQIAEGERLSLAIKRLEN